MDKESASMYKEHILELWKHPENYGSLAKRTHEKRGFNELCGDDITIQLLVEGRKIADAMFTGKGCALCMASASMLTEKIKGMLVEDVLRMNSRDMRSILEVEIHPARIKCVLLPLESCQRALNVDKNSEESSKENDKGEQTVTDR
jgi:nitrogen fixation protein NifU and related proteins